MFEKATIFHEEQRNIINKIIEILELDNKPYLVLYEMDKDEELQKRINNLIPEIKKFFRFDKIKGVRNTDNTKRIYLSIIKCLTKQIYDIKTMSYTKKINGEIIYSKKYIFTSKILNLKKNE